MITVIHAFFHWVVLYILYQQIVQCITWLINRALKTPRNLKLFKCVIYKLFYPLIYFAGLMFRCASFKMLLETSFCGYFLWFNNLSEISNTKPIQLDFRL